MGSHPVSRINPLAVGPSEQGIFVHAVEVPAGGRTIYISAQSGVSETGQLRAGFHQQCEQAIRNLIAVLATCEMTTDNLIRIAFYVTNAHDIPVLRNIRRRLLDIRATITILVVAELETPETLFQVEAVAVGSNTR